MNTENLLRECFRYNDWATTRVLDLAAPVADEELDRPHEMGPGTLRKTLRHLYEAERNWLRRWDEAAGAKLPAGESLPDVAAVRGAHEQLVAAREAFLGARGDDAPRQRVEYRSMRGERFSHPLGDLMLHVTNHGIHHRAQALNMLRHAGVNVPGLDYLFMKVERPTIELDAATQEALRGFGMTVGERLDPPARFDLDTLLEYLRYSDWATRRIVTLASELSDAQLDRPFEMGMGTLRKTLTHIRDAEQWWTENWNSEHAKSFEKLPETTSIADLTRLSAETAQRRDATLESLGTEGMQAAVEGELPGGLCLRFRIGETVLQLCGHGTHHRAQAVNMLRRLGAEPPGLDYVLWVRQQEAA